MTSFMEFMLWHFSFGFIESDPLSNRFQIRFHVISLSALLCRFMINEFAAFPANLTLFTHAYNSLQFACVTLAKCALSKFNDLARTTYQVYITNYFYYNARSLIHCILLAKLLFICIW